MTLERKRVRTVSAGHGPSIPNPRLHPNHETCCDNCRQAAAELDSIRTLALKWADDEKGYPVGINTSRLTRLVLHVCANELRARLGMPLA